MRRMLGIVAVLSMSLCTPTTLAAEPLADGSPGASSPAPILLAGLPIEAAAVRQSNGASKLNHFIRQQPAPLSTPILIAGRCGSSNVYCSNPTPYCCGTGPANYYCARDVNGCTR